MLLNREQLENKEEKFLAPYAALSKFSQGREFEERESEFRTCFQKDRDRIIHSRAFRRLKGKTQVFVNVEGDHFRTRLTHSMEVAQVSRDVARALNLNEDLAESIALAHDLGHTPFGHAGQDALNDLMREYGLKFEHNEQSRRVVTYLENIYPNFRGLNLTCEVREGLMKHQTVYDNADKQIKIQPTLEAQIVDFADEIAYNCHDLDDGLRAKILDFEVLKKIPICQEALAKVREDYGDFVNEKIHQARFVSAIMNLMIDDLLQNSAQNLEKNKIKLLDDVCKSTVRLIRFSSNRQIEIIELEKYLYQNFYMNQQVLKLSRFGQKTIQKLFNYFLKHPEKLPADFQIEANDEQSKIIDIKDYIAGMTDEFAIKLSKDENQ
ncbi:MAG: deoxyguanosinetriphosphate triphosphohydrolase, dGTPase [Candidatus Peregrinibacteria bacterium GW2011_GWF2_33_10]|nr:MAG: deoxyguanosinetriphosphate triphosphohydrolase, dGTPase [Candidatus Peregrinibacteria bacterium GW2011_GWF2_33_10]OGJ44198.1 MAG: deoxyguanosinetriphosphate triphosphohydrolase [Candidatus Peregrinibacteria bacterium RIFOXYA2_FULL_33_21]OGJ46682.1 MAG: deoxyguanosinetriphosphate triphosphohydrolase [Candidatus Peregrinibacteria bacterium RIFOXYA12_FULL_33_12]OGJ51827.1 MAG: deoxyguanosinetriphosphate triphosphohydrolase [Candidatus Peregrinibacteria bacterium RIFOXYB2_FULL_33_20]